ncbi:response regulator transcription factor [Paenibacillus sp.]|uniref:response regulator transcription factor n=1 Tax=Paenibacillus sp. TaxID=58172 RepID=UPI002D6F580D|nr:response regulator [Paenibacillus sp.]HZG58665.1 response regulator [Paenibacillus sp.]
MNDVLIVDDEPMARSYLKHLTDWSAFGFRIRDEAANGEQALQLAKSHYYSLILTDVRMPVMNGLEFIAELRRCSDTAVVIVSGYEDFEYARQGLQLGVQNYLLKPVVEDDLIDMLQKIRSEIEQKRLTHKRLHLGMSALRDQFLRRWAHGQAGTKEFLEQRHLLHLDKPCEGYYCLLIEMDFFQNLHEHCTDREIELKRFAIRNILEEVCRDAGFVFEESEERYGFIGFGSGGDLASDAIYRLAETIAGSVRKYTKDTVSIGLGENAPTVEAVASSFKRAEKALDEKFLKGSDAILDLRRPDIEPVEQDMIETIESKVVDAIRSLDRERVTVTLRRLWEGFAEANLQQNKVKPIVLEILVTLFRTVKETGGNHSDLFNYQLGDYEYIMKAKTIQELHRFAEKRCIDVLELLQRMEELQPSQLIQTILKLIDEQYDTNISLRSVAQQVYMNSVYLGQLFKNEVQCTFNDYLLKVRMEKAKELLLQTDMKVYEIAQKVGYRELDWFYKRFKTYTGYSAGEYRTTAQRLKQKKI